MEDRLLPAVQKAYDINLWLMGRIERFSRKYKFTLGDRLQQTAIDLALTLLEAAHARSKQRPLYRANRLLDQLRLLIRMAHAVRLFSERQYRFIGEHNEELGRMIGGWLRSLQTGQDGALPV